MGVFIIVAAVMMSAAIFSDTGKPFEQIQLDRVPPPLPENVGAYETLESGEHPRESAEDPTIQHRSIALAH